MPLPDVGSRVVIVRVEKPELEEFVGFEGAITQFTGDGVMVKLDGLPYPMEFTVRDVKLL